MNAASNDRQVVKSKHPVIATLLAGVMIVAYGLLSYGTLSKGWADHVLNMRFEDEGIKVSAALAGYEYVKQYGKNARSGDRPILLYVDQNDVTHKYLATEYGIAYDYFKETLPTKMIEITYLRSNPSMARVEKWYSSNAGFEIGMGLFLAIACIGFFAFLFRALVKASVTMPER